MHKEGGEGGLEGCARPGTESPQGSGSTPGSCKDTARSGHEIFCHQPPKSNKQAVPVKKLAEDLQRPFIAVELARTFKLKHREIQRAQIAYGSQALLRRPPRSPRT